MFCMLNQSVPAHTLARVNFPPYVVKALTERHIIVAGGGGEAKTGVVNSIEIYELLKCSVSNTCRARRIAHFDTGNRAVMNATIFRKDDHFIFATGGRFGTCVFYKIKFKIESDYDIDHNPLDDDDEDTQYNHMNGMLRRRMSSESESAYQNLERGNSNELTNLAHLSNLEINLTFEISKLTEFQADFDKLKEPYLKVIKYSETSKLVITGGSDGFIRLFGYPDLKLITELPAHKDEITNLSIDASGSKLVSISRDRRAFIWNLKERSKLKELKLNFNYRSNSKHIEYDFRDCAFSVAPSGFKQTILYTVHNQFVRTKPPSESLICRWNTRLFESDHIVYNGMETFSRITVSDDGKFIGIGSLSGTVEIFHAFSLDKIYTMTNSHKLFVTGVEFLSSTFESRMLTGDQEASLLSISVDNHIVVHHVPKLKNELGFLSSSVLFVVSLFLIYLLLSFLGI